LELSALVLDLAEQPHVFKCNGGLIAEGPQQRKLSLAERPYFLPAQQNRAERLLLAEQRHDDNRAVPGAPRNLQTKWVVGPGCEHVIDLDGPAFEERAAGDRIAVDRHHFGYTADR